jgi:predicted ester cyclase
MLKKTSAVIALVGAAILSAHLITAAAAEPVLTPDLARTTVSPLYEALNEPSKKDVAALLAKSTTDDFKSCATETECGGRDYLTKRFKGFGEIIPDLHWTIKEVWVSGDKAFVLGEATGTPVRPFLGTQPTGRSFKTISLDMFIIRESRISFSYHVENWIAAIRQVEGK